MIPKEDKKSSTYGEIAQAQAQAGDVQGALKTAALITEAKKKSSVSASLAETLANTGAFGTAQKVADAIADPAHRAEAYLEIAEELRRVEDFVREKMFQKLAGKSAASVAEAPARAAALYSVANDYEYTYNMPPGARRTLLFQAAKDITVAPGGEDSGYSDDIAQKLGSTDALAEAVEQADRIGNESYRDDANEYLASGFVSREDPTTALVFASRVKVASDRATAFLSIAEKQKALDRDEDARKTLALVFKAISATEKGNYSSSGYKRIAVLQARLGDYAGAFESIGRMPNTSYYDYVFTGIAAAQLEAGNALAARETLIQAMEASSKMKNEGYKNTLFSGVSSLQVKLGDFVTAKKTAARITDESNRDSAFNTIVVKQAEAGDFAAALESASLIGDEERRGDAQDSIARKQAEAGDFSAAEKTASRIKDAEERSSAYRGIASHLKAAAEKKAEKETGATEGADKTPADMKAVREALYKAIKAASDIKDPYDRYYSFRSSAMDMWRAGDKGAAHNALRRAAESVPRIDSLSSKNSAYESIVSAWVEIGEMKQALSALANVRGRIERYNAYKTIARQQTKDGDMKAARETLATARGLFPIPPEQQKAWMDAFMAAVLTGAQDSAGAQALMDGIPQGPWRSRRLASIASTRLSGDDLTGAMETAGEITVPTVRYAAVNNIIANRIKAEDLPGTRKAIDLLQDPYVQGTWLMKLAGLRMAKGDTDGALALLSSIPVPREKVWALLVMGQGRLFAGDTAGAKKLITAAAAVDGLTSPYWKAYALATAARGLNRAGDQSGASRLMARASREAGNVTDAKEKAWAAVWITGKRPVTGKDKGSSSASTGTPKNEELEDWIAMIDGSLDYPLYKGIKEYIQSLGEKDAEAMVSALASAAADLNEAMGKMKKKEVQWRAKRSQGSPAAQ
ncbi:MAG: hypothetical protein ISR48_07675 [Alphaproteobacteria bacterium]|nr:hypothetical protein [Alphaproteobacteria bacterium]